VALILRIVSRWTAWERENPEEIVDHNFRAPQGGTDLRPSLYETADDAAEIVRVMAEHSTGSNSVRVMRGVDLSGICPRDPIESPGGLRFAFTRDRHRELVLEDRGELIEIVRRLLPELATRARVAEKSAMKAYVHEKVEARDSEWLEFFTEFPDRARRYGVTLPD